MLDEHMWSWCRSCSSLHYSGAPLGACPAGGKHSVIGSGYYTLWSDHGPMSPLPADKPGQQGGFRCCMNCRGLYFAGNGKGVCPADSVGHTCAPNDRWIWLPREGGGTGVPLAAGESMQAGWRWCPRCQGVFHGPGGSGACPAGNSHVDTGSGHYAVTLGPLVTKTISLNLSAPGLFGDPMYVVADSKGVLRCERPIYLGSQGFALEPSDDGRVLLRWPQNNFYVLVDNATQALVARGGREHATRFTLIPRGGARFHFACEGGSVVVSPKLGDPVTVGPPGGDPRLPRMVIASDARAIGLLNWR